MKADRNTIVLKRPASFMSSESWRTAIPIGNGLTGALMFGCIKKETIAINRHDLWTKAVETGELPDLSAKLREMREKIAEGDYNGANGIMSEAMKSSGYSQTLPTPLPLGELKITRSDSTGFTEYARGVKIDRAEAFTRWNTGETKHERRMFASRADDMLFIKVKGGGESYSFGLRDNGDGASRAAIERMKGSVELHIDTEKAEITFAASNEGEDFGAVLRFYGYESVKGENEALTVSGDDYTIIIKTFAKAERSRAIAEIEAKLPSSDGGDIYRENLARNLMRYSLLYNSVSIELASKEEHKATNEELLDMAYDGNIPPALLEKLWRFGRYLFISGTNEEGMPFPLYGLWHGSYEMPWAQNVANENVQLIYMQSAAGGLDYAFKPLIKYYCGAMKSFELNAKRLFGCDGIFVPAYTAPGAFGPSVNVPVILNWISCAGWLSLMFWDYYRYTGDRDTLTSDILPFMNKTAQFWESYLTYEDGKCVIAPSVSPENTPANLMPQGFSADMGHPCPEVKNATMDFAILKALLNALIEASDKVNISFYSKNVGKWRKILSQIPDYEINSDGAVKEWLSPDLDDNYRHRHLSHLFPLFPGEEITPVSDPALVGSFKRAAELREIDGRSGWSFPHMANIHARLGEGEEALSELDLMAKGCLLDNFFTLHNDWRHMGVSLELGTFAPVQLDALMGTVQVVQELAARYSDGTLYILPANCERLKNIAVRDLRFPGGMVSYEYGKDGRLAVSVYAVKDMPLKICTPNKMFEAELESGRSYRFKG